MSATYVPRDILCGPRQVTFYHNKSKICKIKKMDVFFKVFPYPVPNIKKNRLLFVFAVLTLPVPKYNLYYLCGSSRLT